MLPVEEALRVVLTSLPDPPFSAVVGFRSPSSAAAVRGGGGRDRISCLPDAVLSNIVSRLPAKDAVRTAAFSRRWRRVWASTPLVLDDTDLVGLPASGGAGAASVRVNWRAVTLAVSRILSDHPGPFRNVRLTCCCMSLVWIERWLRKLAAARVEDLVLVSRPFPVAVYLPADIFCIPSLRSLYLGFWEFPDTAGLPRIPAVFPHLREIGLFRIITCAMYVDHLLACSPVLEKLAFVISYFTLAPVRVRSRSLRCLVFWMSLAKELAVVVTPFLERLILWQALSCTPANYFPITVRIGYATKLKVLGYLEPGIHQLVISGTVIEVEISSYVSYFMGDYIAQISLYAICIFNWAVCLNFKSMALSP
jgi:hypothetical protein